MRSRYLYLIFVLICILALAAYAVKQFIIPKTEPIEGAETVGTYYGCGPRALAHALKILKVPATEEELGELAGQKDGLTTMLGLAEAARAKGLSATGYLFDISELKEAPLPLIAHIRDNHFVVVTACNQREVTIIDNHARYKMTLDDFGNIWKGYALVFTK